MGTSLGFALYRHHWAAPDVNEPAKAWVQLIMLVVSVALSMLAGYLIAKQNKATLKDDKPTTLVTRGSFITWVLGVRRVGPLFTWAGDRRFTEESSGKKGGGGGGKGGGAPKQKVWHEAGWHVLAIGPGFGLHRILNNGQAIFQGPITRESHPSGTFIDLGSEGGFFIFWGEPTQPVNTFLGNANRVGVTSRWPYHFYVLWADKRLGPSANWPLLDYEIEVRVESSNLVQSEPHLLATTELAGVTVPIFEIDLAGSGTDRFILNGAFASQFPAQGVARLTGNACPDQDLEVLFSELFVVPILLHPWFVIRTRVHFTDGTLTGCDANGSLQAFVPKKDFGINAAHAIDTILHATWPHGIGLPTIAQDPVFGSFDLVSLEALGVELSDEPGKEDLRTSWLAKNGDTVSTVLGTGLQDLGVMIPIDPTTGLVKFVLVREPTGILPRIRDDLIVDELPETEVLHAERIDRLTFSFPDRNLVDRDATIAVMEDGQISYFETQHARNIQITITTDFKTASSIVQRRSQEELAGGAAVIIKTNRATRTLLPGDAIIVDALPEIMRVTGVKLDVESNKVILKLMADFYGAAKSPFIDTAPPITGGIKAVEPDLQKAFIELPEYITLANPQTIIIARIRAHTQIFQATLHISRDNITYFPQGDEFDLMAGGTLVSGLPAPNIGGAAGDPGSLMLEDTGPLFTALGPDIGTVLDLSADLTNWRLGRQIAVISSIAGIEICFCRNVTFVSGDDWTADGLIRARWDTLPLEHPAGAEIFIFEQADPLPIQDPLLAPEVELFAKTQPQAGGILPLAGDIPFSSILYGKAKAGRPVPAAMLTVTAPDLVNVYETGDDVSFHWGFGTPQSPAAGAGLQGAGVAIISTPSPDEDFVLEIRDITGTIVKRTEILTTNTFTYTNANLVADLGGEPSFQVWVYQRRGGRISDPTKLTVERI